MSSELTIEAARADHMTELARYWMERAQRAEMAGRETICRLALANGGELRLTHAAMMPTPDSLILERYTDLSTMDEVYRAKVKNG